MISRTQSSSDERFHVLNRRCILSPALFSETENHQIGFLDARLTASRCVK